MDQLQLNRGEMSILDFPQELISNILSFLPPVAIIRFGCTCSQALAFIHPRNQVLWRTAFLHLFDDPKDAWAMMPGGAPTHSNEDWDWHRELSVRLATFRAIRSPSCGFDNPAFTDQYINALLSIVDTSKFCPTPRDVARGIVPIKNDRTSSLNLQALHVIEIFRHGIESLIHDSGSFCMKCAASDGNPCDSPLRPVTRSMTFGENEKYRPEAVSRLHILYGRTIRERKEGKSRVVARRKVYDWSLSGPDNEYGPLKRDGSGHVDWSLLEGIFSVIDCNFAICAGDHLAMPQGFRYSIPHRTLIDPTTPTDWARVSGPWLGTYSFVDYSDLHVFNNWDPSRGPRPILDDEREACGDLMKLEFKLDDSICSDRRLKTTLPVSTALPVLFFSGISRANASLHRPMIRVRGCVSLVPGGREVRWRFIISYSGQDQWQLEGVQPGGVRSGGIYGLWSHCDHEEEGPVGPFCYFPMELCKPTGIAQVVP